MQHLGAGPLIVCGVRSVRKALTEEDPLHLHTSQYRQHTLMVWKVCSRSRLRARSLDL